MEGKHRSKCNILWWWIAQHPWAWTNACRCLWHACFNHHHQIQVCKGCKHLNLQASSTLSRMWTYEAPMYFPFKRD
jgi:hypothetical protein